MPRRMASPISVKSISQQPWRRFSPTKRPLGFSVHYPASRIRFAHVPAGMREAGWHTAPGRVLVVWLDGIVEFEPSDEWDG